MAPAYANSRSDRNSHPPPRRSGARQGRSGCAPSGRARPRPPATVRPRGRACHLPPPQGSRHSKGGERAGEQRTLVQPRQVPAPDADIQAQGKRHPGAGQTRDDLVGPEGARGQGRPDHHADGGSTRPGQQAPPDQQPRNRGVQGDQDRHRALPHSVRNRLSCIGVKAGRVTVMDSILLLLPWTQINQSIQGHLQGVPSALSLVGISNSLLLPAWRVATGWSVRRACSPRPARRGGPRQRAAHPAPRRR